MLGSGDFEYASIPSPLSDDERLVDVIIATARRTEAPRLERALPGARVELILQRNPLYWARVRLRTPMSRSDVEVALSDERICVRYIASALRGTMAIGLPARFAGARRARPHHWRPRRARSTFDSEAAGRWFLRATEAGVDVDRSISTGDGTRLAIIDDDAAQADCLGLDALVLVGLDRVPRAQTHGAMMVAWASGCRAQQRRFDGIAPGASVRLYVIPKPGIDVVSLPLAIVRAVDAGADVVQCATYIEGCTSPMLDDALELASVLGRRGRGAAIVFPTGREASSPASSVHASWTLGFGEPASDPRAFCIAPSGRGGGWFLFRDRGGLHPFANRGPAVRWSAPGDDIAFPFGSADRLCHAESSGASAIAAGVLLLVLAVNPALNLDELEGIVTRTCTPADPEVDASRAPLADRADVVPIGRDADGHNAKLGYGRCHAARACLAAADPVCAALVAIGDIEAARSFWLARRHDPSLRCAYSARVGRRAVRLLERDPTSWHAIRALIRHARLVLGRPDRARSHHAGAWLRQLAIVLRRLERSSHAAPLVARELAGRRTAIERALRSSDRGRVELRALGVVGRAIVTRLTSRPADLPLEDMTPERVGAADADNLGPP